jgi:hypothetical protein
VCAGVWRRRQGATLAAVFICGNTFHVTVALEVAAARSDEQRVVATDARKRPTWVVDSRFQPRQRFDQILLPIGILHRVRRS